MFFPFEYVAVLAILPFLASGTAYGGQSPGKGLASSAAKSSSNLIVKQEDIFQVVGYCDKMLGSPDRTLQSTLGSFVGKFGAAQNSTNNHFLYPASNGDPTREEWIYHYLFSYKGCSIHLNIEVVEVNDWFTDKFSLNAICVLDAEKGYTFQPSNYDFIALRSNVNGNQAPAIHDSDIAELLKQNVAKTDSEFTITGGNRLDHGLENFQGGYQPEKLTPEVQGDFVLPGFIGGDVVSCGVILTSRLNSPSKLYIQDKKPELNTETGRYEVKLVPEVDSVGNHVFLSDSSLVRELRSEKIEHVIVGHGWRILTIKKLN